MDDESRKQHLRKAYRLIIIGFTIFLVGGGFPTSILADVLGDMGALLVSGVMALAALIGLFVMVVGTVFVLKKSKSGN